MAPDLAECLGLVAPDGAGPASFRRGRDPLGFAAVPEDVAVVDACGGRDPGGAATRLLLNFSFDQELSRLMGTP